MAKWHGKIGFSITTETAPGKWEAAITNRFYHGDVLRNSRHWQNGEGLNSDINVSNQLSVVSDAFAIANFPHMRYVEMYGQKWNISDIEVDYPRLNITIGGIYNGETED
jgi:hypothetical protein